MRNSEKKDESNAGAADLTTKIFEAIRFVNAFILLGFCLLYFALNFGGWKIIFGVIVWFVALIYLYLLPRSAMKKTRMSEKEAEYSKLGAVVLSWWWVTLLLYLLCDDNAFKFPFFGLFIIYVVIVFASPRPVQKDASPA